MKALILAAAIFGSMGLVGCEQGSDSSFSPRVYNPSTNTTTTYGAGGNNTEVPGDPNEGAASQLAPQQTETKIEGMPDAYPISTEGAVPLVPSGALDADGFPVGS